MPFSDDLDVSSLTTTGDGLDVSSLEQLPVIQKDAVKNSIAVFVPSKDDNASLTAQKIQEDVQNRLAENTLTAQDAVRFAGMYAKHDVGDEKVAMQNVLHDVDTANEDDAPLLKVDFLQNKMDRDASASFYARAHVQAMDQIYRRDSIVGEALSKVSRASSAVINAALPVQAIRMYDIFRAVAPEAPVPADLKDSLLHPKTAQVGFNKLLSAMKQHALGLNNDEDRQAFVDKLRSSIRAASWYGTNTSAEEDLTNMFFSALSNTRGDITNLNMDAMLDSAAMASFFIPFHTIFQGAKYIAKPIAGLFKKAPIAPVNEEAVFGLKNVDSLLSQSAAEDGEVVKAVQEATSVGKPHVRAVEGGGFQDVNTGAILDQTGVKPLNPTTSVLPDSVAGMAATTKAGSRMIGDAIAAGNEAALKDMGIAVDKAVGSFLLPKGSSELPLSSAWVSIAAAKNAQELATKGISELFGTRLMDSKLYPGDNGFVLKAAVGQADGTLFKSAQEAQILANHLTEAGAKNVRVVKNEGGFSTVYDHEHYWSHADLSVLDKALSDRRWDRIMYNMGRGRLFGMQVGFKKEVQNESDLAAAITSRSLSKMRNMVQPLADLPRARSKAMLDFIRDEGPKAKADFTQADFVAAGFTKKEAEAGASYIRLVNYMRDVSNYRTGVTAVGEGWKQTTVAGERMYVRPLSEAASEDVVGIDMNGVARTAKEGDVVYEALDAEGASKHLIVSPSESKLVHEITDYEFMGKIPNYMRNFYSYPYYVRAKENGKWVTKWGAFSRKEAEKAINALKAKDDKVQAQWFRARELSTDEVSDSQFRKMFREGLVNSGKRGQKPIETFYGDIERLDPAASLSRMVHSTSFNAGIGQWVDSRAAMLKNLWGLDVNFSQPRFNAELFRPNDNIVTVAADGTVTRMSQTEQMEQAAAIYQHARHVGGFSGSAGDLKGLMAARQYIADLLYDTGLPGVRSLSKELTGQSSFVAQATKTLGFDLWLLAGGFRQFFMQSGNIPMFLAAEGGLGYTTSGKILGDMAVLLSDSEPVVRYGWFKGLSDVGIKGKRAMMEFTAKKMGVSEERAAAVLKAYRESGYFEFSHGHGHELGTVMQNQGTTISSAVGKTAATMQSVLSGSSYEVGVRLESSAAFLYSLNAFEKQFGRMPKTARDYAKVVGDASGLQLHLNSGDMLNMQKGFLGAFLQFQSVQVRGIARALMGESRYTPAQRAKLALAYTLGFGVQGWGMDRAVDSIEKKYGIEVPWAVKVFLLQGWYGALVNSAFQAVAGTLNNDKKDIINVSGNIGIMSQTPEAIANVFDSALSMASLANPANVSHGITLPTLPTPAGLAALGRIGDAIRAATMIATTDALPDDINQVTEATKAFFKAFPITDKFWRYEMAKNYSQFINAKGDVTMTGLSGADAMGVALGFSPNRVELLHAAQKDWYDLKSGDASEEATIGTLVNHTWQWLGPVLRDYANDKNIDTVQLAANVRLNSIGMKVALTANQHDAYVQGLIRKIQEMNVPDNVSFANKLAKAFWNGSDIRLPTGQDALDWVEAHPFEGSDSLVRQLKDTIYTQKIVGE